MFDVLIFFAVIYFVGTTLMKRVAAAQKKAGAPPRRPAGPNPSGAPPWMRPSPVPGTFPRETASSSGEEPSGSQQRRPPFETLYEAIREQLDPSSTEGEELPAPKAQTPETKPPYSKLPWGSIESGGIIEGASEPYRPPEIKAADAGLAQPVELTGLGLQLNADSLVQGVIFSEILNRKGRGMRR